MTSARAERERSDGRGSPPISRVHEGRVLGGVCAGLPELWGLGTNGLRVVFVLAALCGGVGIVAYLACWLVIPKAHEDTDADTVSNTVLLAWVAGGAVVLVLIGAASAGATVLGLGWVAFGLACAVLAVTLVAWPRLPYTPALLVVGALTLPAAAIALSPVRLSLQTGAAVSRPANAAEIRETVYHSGFGTLLIDLRHSELPSSGTVTLRVDAGIRRTIVALPTRKCVLVRVDYDVHTFTSRLATLVSGRQSSPFHGVALFGLVYGAGATDPRGVAASRAHERGPTLRIDFASQGGSLYVRDYPNDIDPDVDPNWPGFVVAPARRPDVKGDPHKVASRVLTNWRSEIASQLQVNKLTPGPCAG